MNGTKGCKIEVWAHAELVMVFDPDGLSPNALSADVHIVTIANMAPLILHSETISNRNLHWAFLAKQL